MADGDAGDGLLGLGSTHARGRRKKGKNGHGSGRGDKDGHASAAGEVRRRPTRGVTSAVAVDARTASRAQ